MKTPALDSWERQGAVALVFERDRLSLSRRERAGWRRLTAMALDAPDFDAAVRAMVAQANRMLTGGENARPLILTLPAEHVLRRDVDVADPVRATEIARATLARDLGPRAADLTVALDGNADGAAPPDRGWAIVAADRETIAEACAHARRWGAGRTIVAAPAPESLAARDGPWPGGPLLYASPVPSPRSAARWPSSWRAAAAATVACVGLVAAIRALTAPDAPAPLVLTALPPGVSAAATSTAPVTPPLPDLRPGGVATAGFAPHIAWRPASTAAATPADSAPRPDAPRAPLAPTLGLVGPAASWPASAPETPPAWRRVADAARLTAGPPLVLAQAIGPEIPSRRPLPAVDAPDPPPFEPVPRGGGETDALDRQPAEPDPATDLAAAADQPPETVPAPEPVTDAAPETTSDAVAPMEGVAADAPHRPDRRPEQIAAQIAAIADAGPVFAARPTRRPAVRRETAARQSSGGGAGARRATFRTAIVVSGPRLLGITGGPTMPRALMQNADGAVRRLSEGQTIDGWTVEGIDTDRVHLRSDRGRETLRVPRP